MRWNRWRTKTWPQLGKATELWKLFISKPYRINGLEQAGQTQCDALLGEALGESEAMSPRDCLDAVYLVSVILFDVVAGTDFISGLDEDEAQKVLDELASLCSDENAAVRFWAMKTLWQTVGTYRDCVSTKPAILTLKNWKAASKVSWSDNGLASSSTRMNRSRSSAAHEGMEEEESSADADKSNGLLQDSEHSDKILNQLCTAAGNLFLDALLKVNQSGPVLSSDLDALMEILLDELVCARPADFRTGRHRQVPKSEIEPFGSCIRNQHVIPAVFVALVLLSEKRSKVHVLRNLNLLLVQSKPSMEKVITTQRWQSLLFLILTTVPGKPHRDAMDSQIYTFACNLISSAITNCFGQFRRLDYMLGTTVSQMLNICDWDGNAAKVVRQVLVALVEQAKSSGFWRSSEALSCWQSFFHVVKFTLSFVFFMPTATMHAKGELETLDDENGVVVEKTRTLHSHSDDRTGRQEGKKKFFQMHRRRTRRSSSVNSSGNESSDRETAFYSDSERAEQPSSHWNFISRMRHKVSSSSKTNEHDENKSGTPPLAKSKTVRFDDSNHMSQMPVKVLPAFKSSPADMLGKRSMNGSFKGVLNLNLNRDRDKDKDKKKKDKGDCDGRPSATLAFTSCEEVVELVAVSVFDKQLSPHLDVEHELFLNYKQGDTPNARFYMSGGTDRVENIGVHQNRVGALEDTGLISTILSVFHQMNISGTEVDQENFECMYMEKKERNNLAKASEYCQEFKHVLDLFRMATSPATEISFDIPLEENVNQSNQRTSSATTTSLEKQSDNSKIARTPPPLQLSEPEHADTDSDAMSSKHGNERVQAYEDKLKAVASFLATACKQHNNYMTSSKKALVKAISAQLKVALVNDLWEDPDDQPRPLPVSPRSRAATDSPKSKAKFSFFQHNQTDTSPLPPSLPPRRKTSHASQEEEETKISKQSTNSSSSEGSFSAAQQGGVKVLTRRNSSNFSVGSSASSTASEPTGGSWKRSAKLANPSRRLGRILKMWGD